jgi:hypothetical protein
MGGFGSGRYGGTATAEGTASYVFSASAITRALRGRERFTGGVRFDEGKFPVEVIIAVSDPMDTFIELIHRTRDDREADRIVHDRIRLIWTVPTYGGRRWWFEGDRLISRFCRVRSDPRPVAPPYSAAARSSTSASLAADARPPWGAIPSEALLEPPPRRAARRWRG